jgi:hypothetical protein
MKEKISIWEQLTVMQKVVTSILALFMSIGTLYGFFNFIHDKNEKINTSITKQDVQGIVKGISDTNRMILSNQFILSGKVDGIVGGLSIMETNITTHIRSDKSIPSDERLDIIIKMIRQMDSVMKVNEPYKYNFSPTIKKIEKP